MRCVLITGSGSGVGKTLVSLGLLAALRWVLPCTVKVSPVLMSDFDPLLTLWSARPQATRAEHPGI